MAIYLIYTHFKFDLCLLILPSSNPCNLSAPWFCDRCVDGRKAQMEEEDGKRGRERGPGDNNHDEICGRLFRAPSEITGAALPARHLYTRARGQSKRKWDNTRAKRGRIGFFDRVWRDVTSVPPLGVFAPLGVGPSEWAPRGGARSHIPTHEVKTLYAWAGASALSLLIKSGLSQTPLFAL